MRNNRLLSIKVCSTCGEEKDISQFSKRAKGSNDGYEGRCKDCLAQYHADYRENNKELLKENNKIQYLKNIDHRKKVQKMWYVENREKAMYHSAKTRAKRFGLDFDIEPSDVIIPEFCPLLGVRIELNNGKKMHNSPSLDRLDNDLGYVKGNVWVISARANTIKSNATHEEIRSIADGIKKEFERKINLKIVK